MRICLIAREGYPHVFSKSYLLAQSIIEKYPEEEFIIASILDNRSMSGKFSECLPPNVMEVHEFYLEDKDWDVKKKRRKKKMSKEEQTAFRSLILQQNPNWNFLFEYFKRAKVSTDELLMGEEFYRLALECYQLKYPSAVFSNYLKTLRSMYLPLFLTMKMQVPKADLYCCFDTGYAGVLGSMGNYFYKGKLLAIKEEKIDGVEKGVFDWLNQKQIQGIDRRIWLRHFSNLEKLTLECASVSSEAYELLEKDVLVNSIGKQMEKQYEKKWNL